MKYSKKIQKNKGFTIIETLVAVTILMIAIGGPLTIAHKSLLAAVFAQDQITAAYLAQDAMEYIENIKATNILNSRPFTEGLDICQINRSCSLDTLTGNVDTVTNIIYRRTDGAGYDHDDTGVPTRFSRFVHLTDVNSDRARVVVRVTWTNGGISNEVFYENTLFNIAL